MVCDGIIKPTFGILYERNEFFMENIFKNLLDAFTAQQQLIEDLYQKLRLLEIGGGGGGGGGNAVIADYAPATEYKHNALVVDTNNNNLYLVVCATTYISSDVDTDVRNGNLKMINSNVPGNIILLDHDPTQAEIQNLDENVAVIVYNASDEPFVLSE
jgi:hypothetical protein